MLRVVVSRVGPLAIRLREGGYLLREGWQMILHQKLQKVSKNTDSKIINSKLQAHLHTFILLCEYPPVERFLARGTFRSVRI